MVVLALLVGLVAFPAGAGAEDYTSTPAPTWVADGGDGNTPEIRAVAQSGSHVYVGGDFRFFGPRTGSLASISRADASYDATFPEVAGNDFSGPAPPSSLSASVRAIASDGSGGWFIGGDFSHVGGQSRQRLAHVLADGSVDNAWNPGADGPVRTILVSGDDVFVGGDFTTIGGQSHNRLARLDKTTGAADSSWEPNITGAASDTSVRALALDGTTLYAGGAFTAMGGLPRGSIGAVNTATGTPTSWSPNANFNVRALAISGGRLYAGGNFTTIANTSKKRVAAFDLSTGALDTGFTADADAAVNALAIEGTNLYLGGEFQKIGTTTRKVVARVSTSTGALQAWGPAQAPNSHVRALGLTDDGKIFVGGDFSTVGGLNRRHLAVLSTQSDSAPVQSWHRPLGNKVWAIAVSSSRVMVGGNFRTADATRRDHLAKLDLATGAPTSWAPNPDGHVNALEIAGGKLHVGGAFTKIDGVTHDRLASFPESGGAVDAWSPQAGTSVNSLVAAGGKLFVGASGAITHGGQTRDYLGAFDIASGSLESWDPDPNAAARLIATDSEQVFFAGDFTEVQGAQRAGIAAVDGADASVKSWAPDPSAPVRGLAIAGDTVYIGGEFTTVRDQGGSQQTRERLAAYEIDGDLKSWGPAANAPVDALAADDTTVFAGGRFTAIDGVSRSGLAAISSDTASLRSFAPTATWGPATQLSARVIDASKDHLLLGGSFSSIGSRAQPGFARFDNLGYIFKPDGIEQTSLRLTVQGKSTSLTGVKLEYRPTTSQTWTDVPSGDVEDGQGNPVGSWPASVSGGLSPVLVWDIEATLGPEHGGLLVRPVFSGGGATHAADPVTVAGNGPVTTTRFISHESGGMYDAVEEADGGDFTDSLQPGDPAAYKDGRVAKVHLPADRGSGVQARGAINLNPGTNLEFYGGAFYFPTGTLNGPNPKQQHDVDLARWDDAAATEFGGLRLGSDHQIRLIRSQTGQAVETIGEAFAVQEGCWNWIVVEQKLSSDPQERYSKVYVNGEQQVSSSEANFSGNGAGKVRFGAVTVGSGTQQQLDFFMDETFVSNDEQPPPTANACDPVMGEAEPSAIASSVQTPLAEATKFLYEGDSPVQQGVEPDTIEAERAAVLRGTVKDKQEQPLSGVRVSVVDRPEFGYTDTRPDGSFSLAVNGGGELRVRFERDDHLPLERSLESQWQQYAQVDDVVMTPVEDQSTDVELDSGTSSIQVARGGAVTDPDGTRQATIFFPAGTTATMTMPDGSEEPLEDGRVRATEYTVGETGPEAMPGELPASSGYTYAVAYTVDEAVAAGATQVNFDPAVVSYTDNFPGFPVGEAVPAGYYDRAKGAWVAEKSGRVIKVRAEAGGLAELEVDDSGQPASQSQLDALGITNAELQKLAELYEAPKTLWRVEVEHFTDWDLNWGLIPPGGVIPPGQTPLPSISGVGQDCPEIGSIIECEDQVLGETIPVTGSDLSLNYRSERTPGRKAARKIDIPLEVPLQNGSVHPKLRRIEFRVEVAGRTHTETFDSPQPGQRGVYDWDGKDAFGRLLQGSHPAKVVLGHTYEAEYGTTDRFGYNGNGQRITGSREQREITLWSDRTTYLGAWDARGQGLGGWTLDVHHAYDPHARVLHMGDGTSRGAQDVSRVIDTIAGGGQSRDNGIPATEADINTTSGMAVAADGSVYYSDWYHDRIRKVKPDGTVETVAGAYSWDAAWSSGAFGGDGGDARDAMVDGPDGLDVGPDGSLYIADNRNNRVRRVNPDGIIETVAGGGSLPANGVPATDASVPEPSDVAVSDDGTFYIASGPSISRVATDGEITNVFYSADPYHHRIMGLDVAADDSLYFIDGPVVRRLAPDGTVTRLAGKEDDFGFSGDGGPATSAKIRPSGDIVALVDGSFYIADSDNDRIRYVSPGGVITTAISDRLNSQGQPLDGFDGDRGPARSALTNRATEIALGPYGEMYIGDSGNNRIRRISSPLPGFSDDDIAIASEDGRELYEFDATGRHLGTLDTMTGAELYTFEYTSSGSLAEIHDGDGNVTAIERNQAGEPTGVVAPFGQRTSVALDSEGFLAFARNPKSETHDFEYRPEADLKGLLTRITDPKGESADYTFDDQTGRLVRADDRAAGYKTLDRDELSKGYETTLTTRLGRTTKYRVEEEANGDLTRTHTNAAGLESTLRIREDGSREATSVDGTVTKVQRVPDSRFAMQTPVLKDLVIQTPDGRTLDLDGSRQTIGGPLNLQSQTDTLSVNGRTYTTVFDGSTDRFTTTTPQNRTTTTEIDDQGRPTRSEAPELHPATTSYLTDGRIQQERAGPDNEPSEQRVWQYAYESGSGLLDSITDPMNRTTAFDYDAAGRVTKQVMPGNQQILFDYDANGNLRSVSPPSRPAHVFDHNAVDLVSSYDPPNVGFTPTTTYEYNHDQDLDRIVRPDGREITFAYESTTRRLDYVTLPSGQVNLGYDQNTGNVSSITAPGSESIALSYDGALPKREVVSGTVDGSVSRTYDNDLRIASTSVNDGHTANYSYDGDSLLEQAGDLDLERDPQSGLMTGSTLGNIETAVQSSGFGEPDSLNAKFGTQTLFGATFERDKLGRITEKTETTSQGPHTYVYGYDEETGFLESVSRDGQVVAEYTYDANGNRLTAPGLSQPAQYDNQDRLTSYDDSAYEYNESGELETKTENGQDVTEYGYDAFGTLQNVTLHDDTAIDYVTDGFGRRIAKKVDGSVVQRFVYGEEGLGPVAELNADGTVRTRFVYATRPNVPDYMVRNGVTYRFALDHLGSPRAVVNAADGSILQEMDFDEFGVVIRDTQPGFQPFGFAGGLHDTHTGFVRFGARDYDAATGRWTSKDPIGFEGGDTNLYGYVLGDPVNLVDVNGLYPGESVVNTVSNVAAGALNSLTFGLSNKIAGVDGSCAGRGYGFGELLGDLNPRGGVRRLTKFGAKFAQGGGRRTGSISDLANQTGHSHQEIKTAIHQVKKNLPKGGATRNPNVKVDPASGEVYPVLPSGKTADDSIGNIFDHL
jgi:RHS repeat-associated protein